MKLSVLKETANGETRVAATPDSVKKFKALGLDISVQSGAGEAAGFSDKEYEKAGAVITPDWAACCMNASVILTVNRPPPDTKIASGTLLVGMLAPTERPEELTRLAEEGAVAFALEWVPRISRAQGMDVLSSQSNLAGYRAVIEAMGASAKVAPMMMTAAGTIAPAKVLVLGAGVAGLQAIATAKRLGAVVSASDVRPAVKEQVESLGAKFLEVKSEETAQAETAGGYAKEMSEDYKRKQAQLLADTLREQDMVITTALIPGKPAPVLISEDMVKTMKPGAVIVDMAVAAGGNCPLSEKDKIVTKHGVILVGYADLPARCGRDASLLYARNLYNFVAPMVNKAGELEVNWGDEIIKGSLLMRGGKLVHPNLAEK